MILLDPTRRRPARTALLVAVALLGTGASAGCTPAGEQPAATSAASTPSPGSDGPGAGADPEAGTELPYGDGGPEASFRTWLAASRAPATDVACAYMTPELAQRMVDDVTAQGIPGITDCAALIELSATLFGASGQSGGATVTLREETADSAVLDVVYIEGTSCGSVVMRPGDGHWLLAERQTTEC